jgi:hypothetical protein
MSGYQLFVSLHEIEIGIQKIVLKWRAEPITQGDRI